MLQAPPGPRRRPCACVRTGEQAVVLEAQLQQGDFTRQGHRVAPDFTSPPIRTPASRASPWLACWWPPSSSARRGNSSTNSSAHPTTATWFMRRPCSPCSRATGRRPRRYFKRLLARLPEIRHRCACISAGLAEDAKRPDDAIAWYKAVGPGAQFVRPRGASPRSWPTGASWPMPAPICRHRPARPRRPIRCSTCSSIPVAARRQPQRRCLHGARRCPPAIRQSRSALRIGPDGRADRAGRGDGGRLRKLIALKPDHAHAYNALGYSLVDRNLRLDEAETLIRKGLALAPNDPSSSTAWGWTSTAAATS